MHLRRIVRQVSQQLIVVLPCKMSGSASLSNELAIKEEILKQNSASVTNLEMTIKRTAFIIRHHI